MYNIPTKTIVTTIIFAGSAALVIPAFNKNIGLGIAVASLSTSLHYHIIASKLLSLTHKSDKSVYVENIPYVGAVVGLIIYAVTP